MFNPAGNCRYDHSGASQNVVLRLLSTRWPRILVEKSGSQASSQTYCFRHPRDLGACILKGSYLCWSFIIQPPPVIALKTAHTRETDMFPQFLEGTSQVHSATSHLKPHGVEDKAGLTHSCFTVVFFRRGLFEYMVQERAGFNCDTRFQHGSCLGQTLDWVLV